jgi:hypothetical protein
VAEDDEQVAKRCRECPEGVITGRRARLAVAGKVGGDDGVRGRELIENVIPGPASAAEPVDQE